MTIIKIINLNIENTSVILQIHWVPDNIYGFSLNKIPSTCLVFSLFLNESWYTIKHCKSFQSSRISYKIEQNFPNIPLILYTPKQWLLKQEAEKKTKKIYYC